MTVPLEFFGPARAYDSLTGDNRRVKADSNRLPRSPLTPILPSMPSDDVVAHPSPRRP